MYLQDVAEAADRIEGFLTGSSQASYAEDELVQSAVYWQLAVIGEAISRLVRLDPSMRARISEYQKIIGLRNVLVHGYAEIDPYLVWDTVRADLGRLRTEVAALLAEV